MARAPGPIGAYVEDMTTTDFTVRIDFGAHASRYSKALGSLDAAAQEGPLDKPLRELVRMHASQLNGCAPDEIWTEAAGHFDEPALAQLVAVIVTINAWNMISVATHAWTPGSYQP